MKHYDREADIKQMMSEGLTRHQAKSVTFCRAYGMGADRLKVKVAEMRNSKLKTLTQYTTKPVTLEQAQMLDLEVAMKMTIEQLDEHFANVAKQNSYNHIIMHLEPAKVSASGWKTWEHRKVSKRYRLPGRC